MQHSEKHLARADEPQDADERGVGRRGFLRLAGLGGAAPLLAWPDSLHAAPAPARPHHGRTQGNVYERMFGVRPIINAAGPVTALGGTVLSKEVTDAMAAASRDYVDLNELYAAAGARGAFSNNNRPEEHVGTFCGSEGDATVGKKAS